MKETDLANNLFNIKPNYSFGYSELYLTAPSGTNVEELFSLTCKENNLIEIKLPSNSYSLDYALKKYFPDLIESILYEKGGLVKNGIPDFFVHNKKDYMFVEIKSENDSIRLSQLRWFNNHPNIKKCILLIIIEEVPNTSILTTDEINKYTQCKNTLRRILLDINRNPDIDTFEGVYIKDIISAADKRGIGIDIVEKIMDEFVRKGHVFSPVAPDRYKWIDRG